MTKTKKTLCAALALAALMLVGCGAKRIAGTDILDTSDTRAVLAVIGEYQKAAEKRDAQAVLALVSTRYFDQSGTPDPADDMDYTLLAKTLPDDYQKLTAVKLDMQVRQVVVEGDRAAAELLYDGYFRVSTARGEVPKRTNDIQQMLFVREGGTWKIISGL
jgi:hypothetical protein